VRTALEEMRSPSGAWRVEIRRRDDGNLQVVLMRWTDEVVPDHGRIASFWSEVGTAVSITDSIETARDIARELLRMHGGERMDEPASDQDV
jgi:hypothetical protein